MLAELYGQEDPNYAQFMRDVDKDQKGSQRRCKRLLCTGLGRITGNRNTFLERHPHAVSTTFFPIDTFL